MPRLTDYMGVRAAESVSLGKIVEEATKHDLCIGRRDRYLPCDVLDMRALRLHHVIAFFLHYYCPRRPPCRVLDPTRGRENHQFKKLVDIMPSEGIEYVDGDIKPYGSYQASVFNLPFRDNVFHIVVYDPPYLVSGHRSDRRVEDYAMNTNTSLRDLQRYYGHSVLAELARVLAPGGVLIVKGSDFYWPQNSRNLVLFIPTILDPNKAPRTLRLEARYILRYYRQNVFRLQRARLVDAGRPLITTTYYVVFRKTE